MRTDEVLPIWQSDPLGCVDRRWGEALRWFAGVIAAGGGVTYRLSRPLRRLRDQLWVPDDPIIATARAVCTRSH